MPPKTAKKRGPYAPKPVQARVIADHLAGFSNREISDRQGPDRKTVGRILTRPEVEEMLIRYRQQLLSLVPKALDVYDAALLSDDERIRVAVATKLVEGLQLMARGNSQQIAEMAARPLPAQVPDERHSAVVNQLTEYLLEKGTAYDIALPKEMAEIKATVEAKFPAQGKPVASETPTGVLKKEDKK